MQETEIPLKLLQGTVSEFRTRMYPGLGLCDGDRRTQPREGYQDPQQWAREQGLEHGPNVLG